MLERVIHILLLHSCILYCGLAALNGLAEAAMILLSVTGLDDDQAIDVSKRKLEENHSYLIELPLFFFFFFFQKKPLGCVHHLTGSV